jgi:PAS domain S-box-containing protein
MPVLDMNDDVLKESLHDLYERAPCGYIFTLPDGTLTRVNQTFLDWTGYDRAELLARHLQDLLPVPGKMFYENQFVPLLLMQGAVHEVALDLIREDGTRLPVLINSVLHVDAEGSPEWVASTVFAATDRRAYERELLLARTRAEHLAEVVTASSDAIITCSVDGAVQRWNLSAERLLQYSPDRFPGLRLRDILPLGGGGEYEGIVDSMRAGESVHVETVAVRCDGEHIDVSVSITPHTDDLGAVSSLSAIIRDISERRALERLQKEFLAMASHELRTPLAAIQGHAQLMQRRHTYSEIGTETIITQSRQLARLIDDLLLASQIDADRLELRLDEVDVVAAAREATGHIVREGAAIRVEAPSHPVMIRADRHRLGQVFGNLLTNAVKYSADESEIFVRITHGEDDVHVDVVDHGIGIRQDDIPHLFTRFYRVGEVAGGIQGTGLGLYITRRIVEGHGGTITVQSEIGLGSTFTLTFPLSENAPPYTY